MPDITHLVALLIYTALVLVVGLYIGRNNPKLLGELPLTAAGTLNVITQAIAAVKADTAKIVASLK